MKKITAILISMMAALSLTACGSHDNTENTDKDRITVASLKGPTSIGLVGLYSESDNGNTDNIYDYGIYGTADEITGSLIKGETDIAAIPANLASVLYNKTDGGIRIAGINTLGVLYILTNDGTVNNVSDLKGRTVYATGQGTTPEYTLRHILAANGINPDKDVEIIYYKEGAEVISAVSEMSSAIIMLPQPYVTIALNRLTGYSVSLDLTEEWEKTDDTGTIVTGVIVAATDFIEKNPEAFEKFLDEYRKSVDFAVNNPEECAELLEQYDIFKKDVALEALPYCNVTLITGKSAVSLLTGYLEVLYDAAPSSVGGTVPGEEAYYITD